jgi:exopolysaccharide biosynthesis polyprenyl glycosylphosphotransferase
MDSYITEKKDKYRVDAKVYKGKKIYSFIKRSFDIVSSLIGLVISIPIMIIFGILVKIEDKGPILYKQERLGKNGESFYIYKIRSMRTDAEKHCGIQWAQKDDPRVTKIGKFIRKTRIDEIPQLINVLIGQMSIIGPRPERPELTHKFNKEIPGFTNRLVVKPGLTGWAQVNGGYEMTPEEKLKWDIDYINNSSISMDVKILIKTVRVIVTGEGAR